LNHYEGYDFADIAFEMLKAVQDQISALPLLDPSIEEHKEVTKFARQMIYDADNLLDLLTRLHLLNGEVTFLKDWDNKAAVDSPVNSPKKCGWRLHNALIRLCGAHMLRFDRDFHPLITVHLTRVHAVQILCDITVYNTHMKNLPEDEQLKVKVDYFTCSVMADQAIEHLQSVAEKKMCI
jgi:hypothetical protein